ncbi:MAG: lipopolysaccharide assembly protein LapB [Xanthomonadales bacterium]|nr:lipopolysaccharide assembly protein LapB [Xanthomonadales bacterium]
MGHEALWLLLPIAAWSGWLAGRRGGERRSGERFSRLSQTYFSGLNYLLNEQPDKALEVFLKIAELDSETFETQLALGNLFRRRGETDRAIRLHQDLYSRPKLSAEQRMIALLELGEDYMRAGLLDRAEALYTDLLVIDRHASAALRHLISIYQQERDWNRAIEMAERLRTASGDTTGSLIAQFHCELAEQARARGDTDEARRLAQQALAADPRCVRAHLLLGRLACAAGSHEPAIRHFEKAAEIDPDFLSEILSDLLPSYEALVRPDRARAFLDLMMQRDRGVAALLARSAMVEGEQGRSEAVGFLAEHLHQRPSVRGVLKVVDLSFPDESGERAEAIVLIRELLHRLLERKPGYRCNRCGFSPRALHWQCPSCKSWGSIKPVHGVAGE